MIYCNLKVQYQYSYILQDHQEESVTVELYTNINVYNKDFFLHQQLSGQIPLSSVISVSQMLLCFNFKCL